jgi:hypothetical protein
MCCDFAWDALAPVVAQLCQEAKMKTKSNG